VPDVTLVVVLAVVATGNVGVSGCDVATDKGSSGRELRGWGLGCGAVGRLGRVCHRFRGVWSRFGAADRVEVVVDDSIGVVDGSNDMADGGCGGIVSDDVAVPTGVLGCMSRVCVAVSAVLGVTWGAEVDSDSNVGLRGRFVGPWGCLGAHINAVSNLGHRHLRGGAEALTVV
jgi:hypothetical protein